MVVQFLAIAMSLGLVRGQEATVELTADKVFERCAPSVATIITKTLDGGTWRGSGFMFAPNRLATCWHVVSEAKTVTVQFPGGEPIQAKIVDASADGDYAVLAISTNVKPIALRGGQPKPGERLYAIGAPLGLSGSIVDGLMSQARTKGSTEVYQISTPITHGNSGGPVLDSRARVIGIASSGIEGVQSLSFAVPAKLLAAAHTADAPLDFDAFREQRLSGWYTLIDRPIEGDETISKSRMEAIFPTGPNKGRNVLASTNLMKVIRVSDQEVVREYTDIDVTHEKDGVAETGDMSKYKRNGVQVVLDLFGVSKGHREALAALDWAREASFRSTYDYLPESIGCLIKVGQEWSVNFPAHGEVPAGKYSARFVGFETIKGVRCARIDSVFEQTDASPKVERSRWLARGSTEIRKTSKSTGEGIVATHEVELVYWKFGPETLRKKP